MEELIFRALNALAGQTLWSDQLIIFLADYLGPLVILLILIYLAWKFSSAPVKPILFIFGSATVAWVTANLLKIIISRPRPFLVLENAAPLIDSAAGNAFPSGHAAFFFALATAVWVWDRPVGLWLFAAAVLISLARVVAGLHWPSDILAGVALGMLVSVVSELILNKRAKISN